MYKFYLIITIVICGVIPDKHNDIIYGLIEPSEKDLKSLYTKYKQDFSKYDNYI